MTFFSWCGLHVKHVVAHDGFQAGAGIQWVRAHTSFLLQMEWHTEQSDIEDTVAQMVASIGKKLWHTLPTYGK